MSIKDKAKKLKNDIPALFLALKRKDTPVLAKIFAFITVGYALSPIDLIPDFIPVLGYLDDMILLPALVRVASIIRTRFLRVDLRQLFVKILANPKGFAVFCASICQKSPPQKILDLKE